MISPPNYDILRTIGSGAFGTSFITKGYVFEALDRNNGQKVALKRI